MRLTTNNSMGMKKEQILVVRKWTVKTLSLIERRIREELEYLERSSEFSLRVLKN